MRKTIPLLSKIWLKVINLEQSLFPKLEESIGSLSPKEEKLIKIIDFAGIERFVSNVPITNSHKDRDEMAHAFVAKKVYNFHTKRELIDRLKNDRILRLLCGWRHYNEIPSESKFSGVFKEFSQQS
ncbi:MAG: transposase, partial [Sulfurovum sp.]|nr:transposase [Sulfurovum sp.]